MRKICLFLLMFVSAFADAQQISLYGQFGSLFQYSHENPDSIERTLSGSIPWTNAALMLFGDHYSKFSDSEKTSLFTDIKYIGSWKPDGDVNSPITLYLNQAYLSTSMWDTIFITLGKKYKEIGSSMFFNVSNLVSPKFQGPVTAVPQPPSYFEFDWLVNEYFLLGSLMSIQDVRNWDRIDLSLFTQVTISNFNLEAYLYYQKLDKLSFTYNIAYQMDVIRFYSEGILKTYFDQLTPAGYDTTGFFPDIVAGLQWSFGAFTLGAEYLYRQEGIDSGDYSQFLPALTLTDISDMHLFAMGQNYVGVMLDINSIGDLDNLSASVSARIGLPSWQRMSQEDGWETFSSLLDVKINYIVNNIILSLFGEAHLGGEYSELKKLDSQVFLFGLNVSYNYSHIFNFEDKND